MWVAQRAVLLVQLCVLLLQKTKLVVALYVREIHALHDRACGAARVPPPVSQQSAPEQWTVSEAGNSGDVGIGNRSCEPSGE